MKKLIIMFLLLISILLLSPAGAAVDEYTGAVAKMPYPMFSKELSLEKQKVNITVYSTFIEVDGEYQVKNNSGRDVRASIGFPVYRHSIEMNRGESAPINMKVVYGKKDFHFVTPRIEGEIDTRQDSAYKEWYIWNMDINKGRSQKFRVHYYLHLDRDQGVPHITYTMRQAQAYVGEIKSSDITIDMPVDCEKLSMASQKYYEGESYIYSSIPSPKLSYNKISYNFSDFEPDRDLEVYFYDHGFPVWRASTSLEGSSRLHDAGKMLDGNPKTYWLAGDKGIGSWIQFTPLKKYRDGKTSGFSTRVHKIGIIPGNTASISDFYDYSHLMEAGVEVYVKPSEGELKRQAEEEKKKEKEKEKIKSNYVVDRPLNLEQQTIIQ
ncbi:MAG: hypothetical protein ACLFQV_05835, partial [Vulcanimicrobiota bacterium]